MVLYLLASVVGVVVIVLLVVHLTKSGTTSTGGSTPGTSPTAAGAPASKYVFKVAPKAGSFTLNAAATKDFAKQAESAAAPGVAQIKARGAGQPGNATFAMYNLGSVTTPGASDFKAVDVRRLRRHVQARPRSSSTSRPSSSRPAWSTRASTAGR